mmetsp:Transcript_6499/g.15630  ORF Transcript_6499/g.15630 Transcript_6499/m.15630 type:complete len:376 (+) Transcript_6499:134-1261(+)
MLITARLKAAGRFWRSSAAAAATISSAFCSGGVLELLTSTGIGQLADERRYSGPRLRHLTVSVPALRPVSRASSPRRHTRSGASVRSTCCTAPWSSHLLKLSSTVMLLGAPLAATGFGSCPRAAARSHAAALGPSSASSAFLEAPRSCGTVSMPSLSLSVRLVRWPTPGMARTGRVAMKPAASEGSSVVWSSGLCSPLTSLDSILLAEMPHEERKPVSSLTIARASSAIALPTISSKAHGSGAGAASPAGTSAALLPPPHDASPGTRSAAARTSWGRYGLSCRRAVPAAKTWPLNPPARGSPARSLLCTSSVTSTKHSSMPSRSTVPKRWRTSWIRRLARRYGVRSSPLTRAMSGHSRLASEIAISFVTPCFLAG